ncbi:type I secretion C-terminal target domain-containing protein [Apirhabdus apintestini]|nr:type I secretion C-terminal target domain-containing protein [Enterobacteriaceae bacterium CA-0114]
MHLGFNISGAALTGISVIYSIMDANGTVLKTATVNGSSLLGSNPTISLDGLTLHEGTYTMTLQGKVGALSVSTITITSAISGKEVDLDSFHTGAGVHVNGNILDGSGSHGTADNVGSLYTTLSINDASGHAHTLSHTSGPDSVTINGKYGVLTLHNDGSYNYSLNSGVDTASITSKETFDYHLAARGGATADATLTVDMHLAIKGGAQADIATSTAYDDTYTLGASGDTVMFHLLNASDATGGNGTGNIWTDFSAAQGDHIDVNSLLSGFNASSDVGDYLSVSYKNGDTVVSIDRDGEGSKYHSTQLITLEDTHATLEELLQHHNAQDIG